MEDLLPPFEVACCPLVLDVEESVKAALLFHPRQFMHLPIISLAGDYQKFSPQQQQQQPTCQQPKAKSERIAVGNKDRLHVPSHVIKL